MFQADDPINLFRLLDATTPEIVFWGDRFNLRAIVDEADRVLPTALSMPACPDPADVEVDVRGRRQEGRIDE